MRGAVNAMSLWNTRRESERSLAGNLSKEAGVLLEAFDVVDECVARLEKIPHPFAAVCGVTIVKARNLALGCYSLSLDALAQEAGALLRPLLEALELLTYFRLDPSRIDEAREGRLPKAGVVAKNIEGKFKDLREYLNAHASHFRLTRDSTFHLIDVTKDHLRPIQPFSEEVLRLNMHALFSLLIQVGIEAAVCAGMAEGRADDTLAGRIDALRLRGLSIIDSSRSLSEKSPQARLGHF